MFMFLETALKSNRNLVPRTMTLGLFVYCHDNLWRFCETIILIGIISIFIWLCETFNLWWNDATFLKHSINHRHKSSQCMNSPLIPLGVWHHLWMPPPPPPEWWNTNQMLKACLLWECNTSWYTLQGNPPCNNWGSMNKRKADQILHHDDDDIDGVGDDDDFDNHDDDDGLAYTITRSNKEEVCEFSSALPCNNPNHIHWNTTAVNQESHI